MELSFLLSDASVGPGHELLRSITHYSLPAIAFVKDFEDLTEFQRNFPGVIWIAVDINRNLDTFTKFLKVIPVPNYIVSFAGPNSDFSQKSLEVFRSSGVLLKERERGHLELTLEEIVDDDDDEECRILVNVVKKRSELKRISKCFSKKFGKLVKGAKNQISSFVHDDGLAQENEPLISRPNSHSQLDSTSKGFFASIFTFCCRCFAPEPETEYCFQSPQDLRLQMRSEQFTEIRETFKKLHEASLSKWNITLLELQRKESQKLEELVAKVNDLRMQEDQELSNVKDKQNRNTRERLSSVLSAETIRRIEESRSRQTKGTVKYDADRVYREGQTLISKQVAIDKAQLRERHYFELIEDQLKKLSSIQQQYQTKSSALLQRFFGTW